MESAGTNYVAEVLVSHNVPCWQFIAGTILP